MTTKDNNQNNFFKKVGNHYDLTKVSNIEIKDDEALIGKKLIKIVFYYRIPLMIVNYHFF